MKQLRFNANFGSVLTDGYPERFERLYRRVHRLEPNASAFSSKWSEHDFVFGHASVPTSRNPFKLERDSVGYISAFQMDYDRRPKLLFLDDPVVLPEYRGLVERQMISAMRRALRIEPGMSIVSTTTDPWVQNLCLEVGIPLIDSGR